MIYSLPINTPIVTVYVSGDYKPNLKGGDWGNSPVTGYTAYTKPVKARKHHKLIK